MEGLNARFMRDGISAACGQSMGDGWNPKNPSHSSTFGQFLIKGWNYCQITAFLIDSQAKFP
jgi:hypothetical protein